MVGMETDPLKAAFDHPADWRTRSNVPADFSLMYLVDRCQTEADAYKMLEEMRWGDDGPPACPHCGSTKGATFLNPENGTDRKTRTGSKSQRRVWKCRERECRKQFSALTNTPFHGMKIPVRKLLFVVFELCSSKNGVSSREIERKYDLTAKSAWFLLMRIREGMGQDAPFWTDTEVVADETYIGGEVKRMNRKRRESFVKRHGKPDAHRGKSSVLTLINRRTGEAYSRVINDVGGRNLRDKIEEVADVPNVDLHTDGLAAYRHTGNQARSHEVVNHQAGEYVNKRGATTNMAESFFAQLKRSIDGTHHHVSSVHLPMYLKEFDFRHNTHQLPDSVRMGLFYAGLNGKRITYKPVQ